MLARPPAWLFGGLVGLKNKLYDQGRLPIKQLPRPVISVGNLAMGGTGKTPFTAELVQRFSAVGCRVAVLSRGYGREQADQSRRVTPEDDWRLAGDEPLMLARRHPRAAVCVGPSRYAAAKVLPAPPDVYLIDDGFQHRQLYRDCDIVLLDASGPPPRIFPRGYYREGWMGLKRANIAVLTRCDQAQHLSAWHEGIRRANPQIPILELSFQSGDLCALKDGTSYPQTQLRGKRIAAYCGIAKPEPFFKNLTALGATLVEKTILKDHQALTKEQLKQLRERCIQKKLDAVITTEKDAVKLDPTTDFGVSLFFLTQVVSWCGETADDLIVKPFVN
nr:tetraacyldisaccharide 4'-kinase [Acanthopleuribacter pedis]